MNNISIIIMTMNEEMNISRCLENIKYLSDNIFVVDSGSTDLTTDIAKKYGAHICYHDFADYASQFNWALDNLPINTKWVMRLDADELIPKELCDEIKKNMIIHDNDEVNGFVLKLKTFFMGKCLIHGGVYPFKKLMVFKYGIGRIEQRKMDEHTVLSEGIAIELKNDGMHYDFKNLDAYIKKHNWYATREALDYIEQRIENNVNKLQKGQIKKRRKLKILYYKLPAFLRAFMLFTYYYIFRMGFLDGKEGLIYNFLGVYWYRFLVDSKIYEYEHCDRKIESTGA